MNKIVTCLLSGALLASTAITMAYAETPYEGSLTGDWKGLRSDLSNKGVDIEAVYTIDGISNVAGGIRRHGRVLDNIDVTAEFDGEKLYNIKGSTVFLYFLANNGGRPNAEDVGSFQGVDNIEVATTTAKLYEAWIQQKFMDDEISIRAGLYDLNSEFYVTDSSGLFLNSTFGVGTELAQSGATGPSIFPTTSLGIRTKWQPSDKGYFQFVVLDGVAGDPNNQQRTHFEFNDNDGLLIAAEASYNFDFARLALGSWTYTDHFDDLIEVDSAGTAIKKRNHGVYAMAEKNITENTTAFARLGVADKNINQADYAWSVGATINDIIPSRADSQLGIAASGAHNSSKYKRSQVTAGTPADSAEIGFELTYSEQILPWLRVQPDVQYTINPGTNPALEDSWMVGVRLEVNF